MTATLRFGTPGPSDAEQVLFGTRWGSKTVPQVGEWRTFFPYAMGITATAHQVTWRVVGGTGTESIEINTPDRVRQALFHPDSGIATNGLNAICYFNAHSSFETWATVTDTTPIRMIQGIHQDLEDEWMPLSDGTALPSVLTAILTTATTLHSDHPSVIAYVVQDDLGANQTQANRASEVMIRTPEIDVANRPASPAWLFGDTLADPDAMDKVLVFGSSHYAVRWASTGVRKTEGDFTIQGGTDWQSYPRAWVLDYPDAHIWWWLQAHQLGDGSVPTQHLAYPTAREIRKMVWEAVGSGVKGFLWFIFTNAPEGPWDGLAHPNSRARMEAVSEMAHRVNENIRQRLLTAAPVTAAFTASGGGSGGTWLHANFANAYISTLQDVDAGVYYCVVCNRSLSTASVTISSATLTGNLISLETGATVPLGSSVSLPPLDGSIYRFVTTPTGAGVPSVMPSASDSTETWWAGYWANPDSVNHVPYGSIVTHPSTVDVSAPDLQSAIDAAPDNTTFRLAPGTYDEVTIVGRNGIHIVPQNPASRPVMRGFTYFSYPSAVTDYQQWVRDVVTTPVPAAVSTFMNPPGDILIRNIDFVQVTNLLSFEDDTLHYPLHVPLLFIGASDVCVEGCTFTGYKYVDANGFDIGSGAPHHHGFMSSTGGVRNHVFRNNTCNVAQRPNGNIAWTVGVYWDGATGCAVVDNVNTGRAYQYGQCLFLVNDDFMPDTGTELDGIAGFDPITEIPHSKYVGVFRNTGANAGHANVNMQGRNMLMAENTCTLAATAFDIVRITGRCDSSTGFTGYDQFDNVIRDNTYLNGTITPRFLNHEYVSFYACGSRIGRTTITGNVLTVGNCAKWHEQTGAGTVEPPLVVTNNTDNAGTRDGV
jgi:hypothetical protein